MTGLHTKNFRAAIESRIKKRSVKSEDVLLNAIYLLLRKLKGHNINDVLKMPVPQFLCLVELISKEIEYQVREQKKSQRIRKR